MGKKVFISHATADRELINILIEFLNAVGINNDDVFCTSISGALEGGRSFVEQIKDNVQGSKVVIFLLTERFFLSYFCLAELGAAWALNQNILPVIVPPISTTEYNSTPLISVQALSMGSSNFTRELFNDLVRKDVIGADKVVDANRLFDSFNSKIKTELGILRKDSKGFYVARLVDSKTRQMKQPINQPALDQLLVGNRFLIQNETLWKLNGLLDIERDSSITEHWVTIKMVRLASAKLQFTLGEQLEQTAHQKLFAVECFYELP